MANELINYLTYRKPSKIGTKEIKNIRSIESAFLTFCKVVLVKSHSTNKENSTERKRLQSARNDNQAKPLLINDNYWDYNSIKASFDTIINKLTQIENKTLNKQTFQKLLDEYRDKHPNFPDIISHINLKASREKALKGITKPKQEVPVPQSKEKKSDKPTPPKPSSKPPEPPHKSKAFTTPQKSSKSEVTEKKVNNNEKTQKERQKEEKAQKKKQKEAEKAQKKQRKEAEKARKKKIKEDKEKIEKILLENAGYNRFTGAIKNMNAVESLLKQYVDGEGPLSSFDYSVIEKVLKEYGIKHSISN